MPRVTTHTARKSKYDRRCTGCGKNVKEGQRYYHWTRRVGPKQGSFRHVECGMPRASELSSRKTAIVEDAISDYAAPAVDYPGAITDVTAATPVDERSVSVEVDTTPFEDAVSAVVEAAEDVGNEYEESADNMPESLQYGTQAEAMREVAQELLEWADNLRDVAEESFTVDLEEVDEFEDWSMGAQTAIEDAWQEKVSAIEDAMGNMPEYQG